MIRWLALAVLIVAISAASAWFSLSIPTAGSPGDVPFPAPTTRDELKGPPPSIVLDEVTTFDFGMMGQEEVGTRDFVIGNEGPGDLILTGTQPTCSCTVGNLKPGESVTVGPGGTFTVTIRWETRDNQGRYEKQARIETNDPRRPAINFTVKGEVRPDLVTLPPDGNIDLRRVPNDRPQQASAVVASPSRPETVITELSSSRPDLLKLTHRPLTAEELTRLELKAGYEVIIEVQPTGDLGPFLEEVIVRTDHPKRPEVRLTVGGTIIGPISVVPDTVRMSDVFTSQGQQASIILWVQGRPDTTFEVVKKPDALNVAVAPTDHKGKEQAEDAAGRAYRMTVSVKPGTSPGIIDDPIILKTDHPRAAELIIPVEIRVLGAG